MRSHKWMWMFAMPAVAFAVFSAVTAAGCGGSPAGMVAATGVEASMFASQEYGFSFRYPQRCTLAAPDQESASSGPALQVVVADPDGEVVGGTALDVFSVEVYKMAPPAGPSALKNHLKDFRNMALSLAGDAGGTRVVAAPSLTDFAGQPALECEYFSAGGKQQTGTLAYLVPKGAYAYWVRLQSSEKTKGTGTLLVTLDTFRFD